MSGLYSEISYELVPMKSSPVRDTPVTIRVFEKQDDVLAYLQVMRSWGVTLEDYTVKAVHPESIQAPEINAATLVEQGQFDSLDLVGGINEGLPSNRLEYEIMLDGHGGGLPAGGVFEDMDSMVARIKEIIEELSSPPHHGPAFGDYTVRIIEPGDVVDVVIVEEDALLFALEKGHLGPGGEE